MQTPFEEADFLKDLNVKAKMETWDNRLPDNSKDEFGELHRAREDWI